MRHVSVKKLHLYDFTDPYKIVWKHVILFFLGGGGESLGLECFWQ
jgi:hypothetical protein